MATVQNPGLGVTIKNTVTEVWSGTTPAAAAWTDLDLSGTVGARKTLVILKFYNAAGSLKYVSLRPNGETEYVGGNGMDSVTYSDVSATSFVYCLGWTDNSGIIEWYTSALSSVNWTIDLVLWINL